MENSSRSIVAAEVASDCIARGDLSGKALAAYDKKWRESDMGRSLARNYKIKEYFIRQTDDKFNRLIHSAATIDLEEFSIPELIREFVVRNPALLADLTAFRAALS